MFTKFKNPNLLDEEIDRVLAKMAETDIATESYAKLLERLTKLHEMKTNDKSSRVSKDTALTTAANLTGILLIINHERLHLIGSKALGYVKFR
jgi:hypothetical protein